MMKLKTSRIPILCLVLAVGLLYARGFVFRDLSFPSPPGYSGAPAAAVITLHYHERPPYYVTGPLGVYGLCADPAKLAFQEAGIAFQWEKTPANRQLDILKANRSKDCLLGWFRNSEREKFAKYSHYIYQDKPTIALARADNHGIVSNRPLAETFLNPGLILLRKNGYSYGPFIDAQIAGFAPCQEMTNAENIGMLKMIHSGRADYFLLPEEEARELTATSGLLETDFAYIRFADISKGNKRYLLFSQQVADAVIDKINTAIDAAYK